MSHELLSGEGVASLLWIAFALAPLWVPLWIAHRVYREDNR